MAINISLDHMLTGLSDFEDSFQTPNKYSPPEFKKGYPDSIIIHYTAMKDGRSAAEVLCRESTKASAHLVIDQSGKVFQLAPFNHRTWHAGVSEYNGRKWYNHYAIGIEIDNLGWMKKIDGKFSRADLDKELEEYEVVKARHWNTKVPFEYWAKYPEIQLDRVKEICKLLIQKYNIREILGHDEISPGRKQDPGPAFPMEEFRRELLPSDRDQGGEEERVVTASKLNIRTTPNGTIAAQPLKKGTKVNVLEEKDDWVKVSTEIEGWVHKDYIA